MSQEQEIKILLEEVVKLDATDLHLNVGKQPMLRIDGSLVSIKGSEILTSEQTAELILSFLYSLGVSGLRVL